MKLGTQTGSLTNFMYSIALKGEPESKIGMGATVLAGTDRYPATVTGVFNLSKMVSVREDVAVRTDKNGMSEIQEYEYHDNPVGRCFHFRKAKNGVWEEVQWNPMTQRWNKINGYGLRLGERDKYHDFSF